MDSHSDILSSPLELRSGSVLKNRLIKSAMSDSLGNGEGDPTESQIQLYHRWAEGGAAALLVGEVQISPDYAEKPGNLVLHPNSNTQLFKQLAKAGQSNGTQLWLQLGHAGALAHPPISMPKGPSAINIPGLRCDALALEEIQALPDKFAQAALNVQQLGFSGVQIHSAHGFLLSQFLSPLFNQREDAYGGSVEKRMRLLMEVVSAVRSIVDPRFVVAVKLNTTDQLEGGLDEEDALAVVTALDRTDIDLIELSGGTYFPGAKSSSDSAAAGAYFLDFSRRARKCTAIPLMVTGGFKKRTQAANAIASNDCDLVGLARSLVLDPDLANHWLEDHSTDPEFPQFESPPEGGITAWYTMKIAQLAGDETPWGEKDLQHMLEEYERRDHDRVALWNKRFADEKPE